MRSAPAGHDRPLDKAVVNHSHFAQTLKPALESETFTFREIGVPAPCNDGHYAFHGAVERLIELGLIEKVERVSYHENRDGTHRYGGTLAWRYRWVGDARQQFKQVVESSDTLPCGCRAHVPDSRDDPEGVVSCKFCGRAYDEGRFRELIG